MTLAPLSRLEDWKLADQEQDIRGWPVRDRQGNELGKVSELIVDTDSELVSAITLQNGMTYPTSRIELADHAVLATGTPAQVDLDRDLDVAMFDTGDADRSIALRREELRVNKQAATAGAVDVGKKVTSERQTTDVPVAHEEVVVSEHPVTPRRSDEPIGKGQDVRVPVRAEEVDVDKESVVYGEVDIDKRTVTETERVSDTVRREEPQIRREGDAKITNRDRK